MYDNEKLIGMAFNLTCGCTVIVEGIEAKIKLRDTKESCIMIKIKVEKYCSKKHRKDIEPDIYYQEYSTFMEQFYSTWDTNLPEVNTVVTMKNKRKE